MGHSMFKNKNDIERYLRYAQEYDQGYTPVSASSDEPIYVPVPQEPKTVIVMRGLPGSGKSTFVEENFPNAVVCSADKFFIDNDGNYNFDVMRLSEAHQWCMEEFIDALFDKKREVVVDNTNMCNWEYANYILLAENLGYKVRIIVMAAGLHDDTSTKTLAKRNTHGVDATTIARMMDRYQSGLDDEIVY